MKPYAQKGQGRPFIEATFEACDRWLVDEVEITLNDEELLGRLIWSFQFTQRWSKEEEKSCERANQDRGEMNLLCGKQ